VVNRARKNTRQGKRCKRGRYRREYWILDSGEYLYMYNVKEKERKKEVKIGWWRRVFAKSRGISLLFCLVHVNLQCPFFSALLPSL